MIGTFGPEESNAMPKKISIPLPGTPVRGSRTGAPIMALLDLLGRRWALGIVWVLAEQEPLSFTALQRSCDTISPGVLNTRLDELVLAKLIDSSHREYRLTEEGRQLFDMLRPLGHWARTSWAPAVSYE